MADKAYDEADCLLFQQTVACNDLRRFLQSIAILGVKAQDCVGSYKCADILVDIERDLSVAKGINDRILRDRGKTT